MENNVEKFDPSKLMEGVKDRIKSTFVSLIPDDAWDKMLEREIYTFTTGTVEVKSRTNYDKKDENGNFIVETWEERKPYTQTKIKDEYGYGTHDDISPLQKIIREELEKKFREDLINYLNSSEYTAVRDQYAITAVSEAVEDALVKNSGAIFKNIMCEIMQDGFDKMKTYIDVKT